MEEKKVLLSVKDLNVKFQVRGRTLTALRGISLDIYENESIAIVGESGSGKSVFTQTFAGMLDANGYVDSGEIIFNDEELADTVVELTSSNQKMIERAKKRLDEASKLEPGAATWLKIQELEKEKKERFSLGESEMEAFEHEYNDLSFRRAEAYNKKQTFDPKKEKDQIHEMNRQVSEYDEKLKELEKRKKQAISAHEQKAKQDTAYNQKFDGKMADLKARYEKECAGEISQSKRERNQLLAKEICLSIGRYPYRRRMKLYGQLMKALEDAMRAGVDLGDEKQLNHVFDQAAFRVRYLDETPQQLHGVCTLNLARINYAKDWEQIRGSRIAFIFQDPMTSLNPIISIGKQLSEVIMLHQHLSEPEANVKAIEMMQKVGIPEAEKRFDDYPFQYSGGMRQRIVIAIALACQPKILICDEPTTALDVTVQAQILKLIKDLQKEFGYTIIFITHDMGVVANIADRVAVLYAGQIIEVGTVREIFYDPRHPYTWALLSSLPQLAEKDQELYYITGTPPSLYNRITGDAFAPRNPYCLKVDTLKEPPMFKVTDTHYAKTWLLDPRAKTVEKPEIIRDIRGTLMKTFIITGGEQQ